MARTAPWIAALLLLVASAAFLQAGQQARGAWVMPRLASGHPDLEGVWENNSATPLERPRQFAQKPLLSDEELADLKRRAASLFGPDAEAVFGDALYQTLLANTKPGGLGATGTYSQNWLPDRYFEHRTSLIVDPPDGRLPPATERGTRARATARTSGRPADAVQDMSIQDRCIHYGFPD